MRRLHEHEASFPHFVLDLRWVESVAGLVGGPPRAVGEARVSLNRRDKLLVGRADLAHLLLARLLRFGQLLREPGIVTRERAGFHRQRALELGAVDRHLLVALTRICEPVPETRVLRVERAEAILKVENAERACLTFEGVIWRQSIALLEILIAPRAARFSTIS